MERNTVTTAGELCIGDRFYQQKDKKRIVYQKTSETKSFINCKKDGDKVAIVIDADKSVVFLRKADLL